jgi:hypothetical protein
MLCRLITSRRIRGKLTARPELLTVCKFMHNNSQLF